MTSVVSDRCCFPKSSKTSLIPEGHSLSILEESILDLGNQSHTDLLREPRANHSVWIPGATLVSINDFTAKNKPHIKISLERWRMQIFVGRGHLMYEIYVASAGVYYA